MAQYKINAIKQAAKTFKLENTLKAVQTMRKSLIEASTQALLTADELEDASFMGADENAVRGGTQPDYSKAMDACKSAEEHIRAAISATEEAKTALRGAMVSGGTENMIDDAGTPESIESVRKSMRRRRQIARVRRL